MSRRFLNVIVQDVNTRVNSLHLIDPWKHLFHPPVSAQAREAAAIGDAKPPEKKKGEASTDGRLIRLHKPQFRFESNPHVKPRSRFSLESHPHDMPRFRYESNPTPTTHSFFSALLRENSLLLADSSNDEGAFLYDIDLNSEMGMPSKYLPKGPDCVCFSAPQRKLYHPLDDAHCFYVLDLSPPPNAIGASSTFEVLTYFCNDMVSQPLLKPNYKNSFYWRTLPPPPFSCATRAGLDSCSFMMVDDGSTSTISVSSAEEGVAGTYTFDMATHLWSRAGDWVLPFYGKAEYVPELGLSFALSADRRRLCALGSAGAGPPILRHTFNGYLDLPEKWSPYKCRLLNLGSGSFCIVSFCKTMKQREFVVLTGVEVKRFDHGPMRMIKHMSKRISLGCHSIINCVL